MSSSYLLTQLLVKAFENECGKWQRRHDVEHAFVIDLRLHIYGDKEEGYRNFQIVLYGPNNYVQVWVREDWDVIPLEGIGWNKGTGDTYIKKGFDYKQGASEWKKVADHDSAWEDGLRQTFVEYEDRLSCFNLDIYKVVPVAETGIPLKGRNYRG